MNTIDNQPLTPQPPCNNRQKTGKTGNENKPNMITKYQPIDIKTPSRQIVNSKTQTYDKTPNSRHSTRSQQHRGVNTIQNAKPKKH